MTHYTDPEMERERELGYNDVMAGNRKGRPGLKHISAYTTGQSEAFEILAKAEHDRKEKAKRARLAALREARRTA